jgi:glycosyltransferase involved in cell wall biosynthesis
LKILHLVGARADHGGILSVLRALASAPDLENAGLEHCVWVHRGYRETRRPELPYWHGPWAIDESRSHVRLLGQALLAAPFLLPRLFRMPPDIIHAHTRGSFPLACLLSRCGRVPVVYTHHAYARRTGMYRRALMRLPMRQVFLTPNMMRHFGWDPEHPPHNSALIPACALESHFEAPLVERSRSASRASSDGPVRIVGLGNLVGWKRWDLLLDALAGMPPDERRGWSVSIWGPVPPDPEAQAYAAMLGHRIEREGLTGTVRLEGPASDVGTCLAGADWFVLPSTDEPCSVALVEALARGVPAVVSSSGGNIDIVEPGVGGQWFRPGDAADLRRVLRGIREGELSAAPPATLRESVRAFSACRVTASYARLYRDLKAGHPEGHAPGIEGC